MRRWIKRGVLAILLTIVAVVVFALVFIHTDTGREVIRDKVETQLAKLFVGGVHLGKVEGSPFGELVVHDVVIDGPDHAPAITVGTLRLRIKLKPLLDKEVWLDKVVLEDVDVAVKRDASGSFEIGKIIKLDPNAPPTKWSVDMPVVTVHRAHLMIDTGTDDAQIVNLDGLEIAGNAHLAATGAHSAGVQLSGTWRERSAPLMIAIAVHDDGETVTVPTLAVRLGAVSVTGSSLTVGRRKGHPPLLGGNLQVIASRDAVAALDARIVLPADLALAIGLTPGTADVQPIVVSGAFGPTSVDATATLDFETRHAIGTIATGDFSLATYTGGKVVATAGVAGDFDVMPGAPGELPLATLHLTGHGTFADLPRADFTIAATSKGQHVSTVLSVAGAAKAKLEAELTRAGDAIMLERATLTASSGDPRQASGNRTPLRGELAVALTAHGALWPTPALAVAGTVHGRHLRVDDLSLGSLDATVDASQVPFAPRGSAHLDLHDVAKGTTMIHHLDLVATASTRGDSTIVASIHSADRMVSVDGTYVRAGAHAGDLTAHVAVEHVTLDLFRKGYPGYLVAKADASRTGGRWAATVDIDGKGIAVDPTWPLLDLNVKAKAKPGSVIATVSALNRNLGSFELAIDLAAPQKLDDIAAWKRLRRESINKAKLTMSRIDLSQLSSLAGPDVKATGTVSGTLEVDAKTVSGKLELHALKSPKLRGIRQIDADLEIQQAPGELVPTLTIALADIGKTQVQAHLAMPARLFDPHAWNASIVKDATIRTDKINIDPALLDRFGITSPMRATASVVATLGPGLRTLELHAIAENLRGTPFAEPVTIDMHATVDDKTTTATMAMTQKGKTVTLVKFDAHVPMSLDELRTAPSKLGSLPLVGTLELPKTPAPELLNVFGRAEVTSGVLDGKIVLGGTLSNPTIVAHIVGTDLGVPPGPRGKPVKVVQKIVIDASGDSRGGKIVLEGYEANNGRLSVTVDLVLAHLMDGKARIKATSFDMAPLFAFAPGPAGGAKGRLDADLAIDGFDARTAKITGQVHFHDARIPLAPNLGTLRKGEIDIAIHEHDIAIKATGKLGRGDVRLEGTVALDGASLNGGQAKLFLRKVSPIGAVEPVVDADVNIKLARKDDQWTADVVVDNGVVKITGKQGEAIKPIKNPSDLTIGRQVAVVRKPGAPPPPAEPSLIANVTLHRARVESDEFHSDIEGKVVITVDSKSVGMLGEISAQSGDVDLFDRRYHVEQASVTFDGTIDPLLSIRLTHDFNAVTTITIVRGRLSAPELTMASDPGSYSQAELLGFLLGGEPGGDPSSGGARDKLTGAGASLIANKIGGYVKKALPFDIDVIRYETASINSGSAITVGTWLTHTLFFAYRQHLDGRPDENTGEGTVEYWLTRRLELEGTAGDRGYDAVDLLWRRRF